MISSYTLSFTKGDLTLSNRCFCLVSTYLLKCWHVVFFTLIFQYFNTIILKMNFIWKRIYRVFISNKCHFYYCVAKLLNNEED